MAHYMFETEWVLTAPIDDVFEVLSSPEDYRTWWPRVKESHMVDPGDDSGIGRAAGYVIRGPWGYRMRLELRAIAVNRPHRLRAVVRGDLVGTATHFLETRPEGTLVRLHWYVSTTKRWMNLAAPLARPLLAIAHKHVMYEGCKAMAITLGARLLAAESRLVGSPTPVPVPQE